MNKTLAVRTAPSMQEIQPSFLPEGLASRAVLQECDELTSASIKGELGISVTEQQIARGPIIGLYMVEAQHMPKPPLVRWHAQDGNVLNRSAQSTAIAFDLSGTRAGQTWTTVITVQLTDAETYDTISISTFVQIRVVDA